MRILIIAAVAALAACSQAEEAETMSAGCDARGVSQWAAGEATYSVEAASFGPDCARAVATIVIRDGSGVPVYSEAHLAAHVMPLAHVTDAVAMQTALAEWTNPGQRQTSAGLPQWPANAESPATGEFPFYPHEGIDRAQYEGIRARNLPVICYVQGMESLNCLVLEDGGLTSIGLQTFPG
jgi:hypothetical protein